MYYGVCRCDGSLGENEHDGVGGTPAGGKNLPQTQRSFCVRTVVISSWKKHITPTQSLRALCSFVFFVRSPHLCAAIFLSPVFLFSYVILYIPTPLNNYKWVGTPTSSCGKSVGALYLYYLWIFCLLFFIFCLVLLSAVFSMSSFFVTTPVSLSGKGLFVLPAVKNFISMNLCQF